MFWRISPLLRRPGKQKRPTSIAAVIPARNEAGSIGAAIDSLKAQQFHGDLTIYVVDDDSSDRTAEIARGKGAIVLHAGPLPPEWTGKLWAVSKGVDAALARRPEYLLLTDADIAHGPTSIADLLARDVPMASVMVRLRCESLPERLLIPAFVFFFFKLYPPKWVADPQSHTAGAAGGCILIQSDVLKRAGGIEAIRGELIDDCALARRVKNQGPIWIGMSDETHSLRDYKTFSEIWNMIARTAFTQLNYSWLMLIGATAAMFVTYIAPPLFAFAGSRIAIAAWALMSLAYMPMLRFYRQPVLIAPLLPVVATFYLGATFNSAAIYQLGSGGQWKGRAQAPRQ